jgi:hypothetical protein
MATHPHHFGKATGQVTVFISQVNPIYTVILLKYINQLKKIDENHENFTAITSRAEMNLTSLQINMV